MTPKQQLANLIRRMESLADAFDQGAEKHSREGISDRSMRAAADAYRHAAAMARGPEAEAAYNEAQFAATMSQRAVAS